ncbi:unnamed protein product [Bemisia tabaci]|uniref:MAGE domain-containing protein n=1 Tax=Bemisia tabaci TaxID=7038 RepID=A0A9P0F6T7_BEMTA|nr:unnamed protein product [Bemisia tabaci]
MSKSQKVMKSGKSSLNKSRASQSQTQSVASQSQHLSEEEFKELVADIVKYILHRHFEGKVTRRTKIRDDIIKSKTRKFDQLMEKVKSRFEKCFGMQLVQMGNGPGKESYTLKNRLAEQDYSLRDPKLERELSLWNSNAERAKDGLLSIVLAFLFMMKTPVKEERLYCFLRNIKVLENEILFTNEDIKTLLTRDFVEQQYLSYKDEPSKDPDEKIKVFSWGDRARLTIKKSDVFKFMSEIYHCSENHWNSLYEDVEDHSDSGDESGPEDGETSFNN